MGEKQCDKCGEAVDEAKAFCPGCGNSFVEEKKRTSVSDFDQLDHTVRLGDTMYNQMLSDMGLSISKKPNVNVKIAEATAPVVSASPPANMPVRNPEPLPVERSDRRGPIIIGIALIAFALLAVMAIVAFLYSR